MPGFQPKESQQFNVFALSEKFQAALICMCLYYLIAIVGFFLTQTTCHKYSQ